MSGIVPPNLAALGQVQYQPASAAATAMECLCQLQEQGGYQQLAGAVMAGDIDRALRSYRSLTRRAPRQPQKADAAPDGLAHPFAQLGQALEAGDAAASRKAWEALDQAVKYAHAHHRHGAVDTPASHKQAEPDGGHIDVRA